MDALKRTSKKGAEGCQENSHGGEGTQEKKKKKGEKGDSLRL